MRNFRPAARRIEIDALTLEADDRYIRFERPRGARRRLKARAAGVWGRRTAARRRHVWKVFGFTVAAALPLLLLTMHMYPFAPVRPGDNYDVAIKNLSLQAFGYCTILGVAACLGAAATTACPKKTPSGTPAAKRFERPLP